MKKSLLVLLGLMFSLSCVFGQEYYDASSPRTYYYNNFESATAGTASTYFSACNSTSTTPATITIKSGSINTSKGLSTIGTNNIGYIKWNFFGGATAANQSFGSSSWEWEFDYKNTTGVAPNDPNNQISSTVGGMTAGVDAWRYWLFANTYNGNNTTGLYVSVSGTSLVLILKYGTFANQYTSFNTGLTVPANTDTYQIRIVKEPQAGYYSFYVYNKTNPATSKSVGVNVGNGPQGGVDMNTYNFSYLEATSAANDHFQWDNFNLYQPKLEYIPITTSPAGITTQIYPGIGNAIPYAVKVSVRGDVIIGRFVINYTGDIGRLFSQLTLYKKAIGQTLSTTGATSLGTYSMNASNTNQKDLSPGEYYYSGGGTDGTTTNVINYFLYADVRNPFSSGYPTSVSYSVSTSASDNYESSFYKNNPLYGSTSTSSVSNPGVSGDIWDWQGTSNSWTANGSWKRNTAATSSAPSASTDIVRFAVANSYTNEPRLTASTTIGTLIIGNLNTVTFKLYPSSSSAVPTLTINTALTLNSGASLTFNGNDATDAGTLSATNGSSGRYPQVTLGASSVSTMASTSVLNLIWTTVSLTSGGSFTLSSDASGTASIGAIATTDPAAKLSGTNYIVQRYFTGGAASNRGWRLMSSPVNNSTSVPATAASTYNFVSLKNNLYVTGTGGTNNSFDAPSGYTANGPTILFYNTSTSNFSALSALTTAVTKTVGTGFYFYFRGDRTTNALNKLVKTSAYATPESNVVATQTGTLNQGSFNYTLTNAGSGYNLVGNPYPSTITMSSSALTGTTGTIYTYNTSGNSITAQPGSINIASGQGFFVKSNNATSSVSFTESLKTSSQVTGSSLLMSTPKRNDLAVLGFESIPNTVAVSATNPAPPALIGLKMVQDSANYDIAYLRYHDDYKATYDEMEDADDLNANGQTVFFGAMTGDNKQVAIASQPMNKTKTAVYLSVNDNTSGTYSIQRTDISGVPDYYDIWLKDNLKKDSLDLRSNDTYNFNLDKNNAATYGNARFQVILSRKALAPYQLVSFTGKKVNSSDELKWNTANEYNYTAFEVQRSFDGVNFTSIGALQSSGKGNYNYTDQSFTSTVYYRLKQVDVDGKVSYSSIVIITPGDVFSIYPNPTAGILKFDLTHQQPVKGKVMVRIYNATGVMVINNTFSSTTGEQNVAALTQGSYVVELIDSDTQSKIVTDKFIKL